MIKFIVGIAIVAFSSFCGYKLAGKYRRKKEFFKQFSTFNERFLNELSYYRRPIKEYISKFTYKGEFQLLLYQFLEYIDTDDKAFFLILDEAQFSFLTQEEKEEISDYFLTLGRGDSQSQKAYFLSGKERINKLRNEAEKTCNRYADLYVKLGFLCGLFILILIL